MREWAKRLSWTEEQPEDAQRAGYRSQLLGYAKQIMDGA